MKREKVAYSIRLDKSLYDSDTLYKMVLGNKENTVMVFQTSGICKIIDYKQKRVLREFLLTDVDDIFHASTERVIFTKIISNVAPYDFLVSQRLNGVQKHYPILGNLSSVCSIGIIKKINSICVIDFKYSTKVWNPLSRKIVKKKIDGIPYSYSSFISDCMGKMFVLIKGDIIYFICPRKLGLICKFEIAPTSYIMLDFPKYDLLILGFVNKSFVSVIDVSFMYSKNRVDQATQTEQESGTCQSALVGVNLQCDAGNIHLGKRSNREFSIAEKFIEHITKVIYLFVRVNQREATES